MTTLRHLAGSLLLAGLLAAPPALAQLQVRSIPAQAKAGSIRHLQDMYVAIDGKVARLAPGAQIRDAGNRLVLPMSIPAGAPAKYLTDAEGMVRQVWLLTPEEAAGKAK